MNPFQNSDVKIVVAYFLSFLILFQSMGCASYDTFITESTMSNEEFKYYVDPQSNILLRQGTFFYQLIDHNADSSYLYGELIIPTKLFYDHGIKSYTLKQNEYQLILKDHVAVLDTGHVQIALTDISEIKLNVAKNKKGISEGGLDVIVIGGVIVGILIGTAIAISVQYQ